MKNTLYLIALILVIGWALGFFFFNAQGIIHLLLVIAVIALLIRLLYREEVLK
ncbi:MAG: lmo0937 family membrane protein [Chitinophagaceae bacterium]|jgi:hypothetical protein